MLYVALNLALADALFAAQFGGMTDATNSTVSEIGDILAAGLMRVLAAKSSQTSAEGGESSLDFSPGESGHPNHTLIGEPHE
jgi:hypothetical protein